MRLAIIGTGISGLTCAHLLADSHDLTLYEANDYVGGHTHTVDITLDGQDYAVDTGFIVFNDWTYPHFIKLLERLQVPSQPSTMSFSVRCEATGLEYCGSSLRQLYAQKQNLFNLAFHRMIIDILRFFRNAKAYLEAGGDDSTMDTFLERGKYSPMFRDTFLAPMLAAIWSSSPETTYSFPTKQYLQFFKNHGLLNIWHRPVWRVIKGGSRSYVQALTAPIHDRIRLNTAVARICRTDDGVELHTATGQKDSFDQVIVATHSDQALRMLDAPTHAERDILSAIPYADNAVTLHTDEYMLPINKTAWASWNYHKTVTHQSGSMVTYNMNMLQSLDAATTFCVTLNRPDAIRQDAVLQQFTYAHPQFSAEAMSAQERHAEISGVDRIHYCGAYWGYGFHEDGVSSGLAVCKHFGKEL